MLCRVCFGKWQNIATFGPGLICPLNRRTVRRLVRRPDSSQSAACSSLWRSHRAVGHRPPLAHANIVVRVQRESVSRDWAALLSVRGSRVLLFNVSVWTGTLEFVSRDKFVSTAAWVSLHSSSSFNTELMLHFCAARSGLSGFYSRTQTNSSTDKRIWDPLASKAKCCGN